MFKKDGEKPAVKPDARKSSARIQELGREIYKQADTARRDVVNQLFEVADSIRSRATGSEQEEQANRVAASLERAANYVNSRALDQLEDTTELLRENVWKTTLFLFILGVIVGLLLNRRDETPRSEV